MTRHISRCDLWKIRLHFLRCDLSCRWQHLYHNIICNKRWQGIIHVVIFERWDSIFCVVIFHTWVQMTKNALSSVKKITTSFWRCHLCRQMWTQFKSCHCFKRWQRRYKDVICVKRWQREIQGVICNFRKFVLRILCHILSSFT